MSADHTQDPVVFTYIGWKYSFIGKRWRATHPKYDGAPNSPTRSWYVVADNDLSLKAKIELWERANGLNVTDVIGVEKQMDELYPY